MEQITDLPPQEIIDDLNNLKADLDLRLPAKKLEKNLLIATWNIRGLGDLTKKWESGSNDSPKRDFHSALCIAEIIKRFDVIAVQEVKENIRALRHILKVLGRNYSFILSDTNQGDAGNSERMAYIFDTRRVQLSGLACELVIPDEWKDRIGENAFKDQFVRAPYAVSFRSESKTFILTTLHVLYGDKSSDRVNELGAIAKWMADWASSSNAFDHNLITLGDFNIDKRGDILHETFISEGLHIPEQLSDPAVTRSIFKEDKYYDQIAWFNDRNGIPNLSMKLLSAGNYDFVGNVLKNRDVTKNKLSWMISDHYPLWAEFEL